MEKILNKQNRKKRRNLQNKKRLNALKRKYGSNPLDSDTRQLIETYAWIQEYASTFANIETKLKQFISFAEFYSESGMPITVEHSGKILDLLIDTDHLIQNLNTPLPTVYLRRDYYKSLKFLQKNLKYKTQNIIPKEIPRCNSADPENLFLRAADQKIFLPQRKSKLEIIGEGSYATVYSYIDYNYGIRMALKRAKSEISARDYNRFREEFNYMHKLDSPNILKVFKFDETLRQYSMEFCEFTLRRYIYENKDLDLDSRINICLEFLSGLKTIHDKGDLHRDLSLQNILIKNYRDGSPVVKISDFGLLKKKNSDYTLTKTAMRGTIRDPLFVSENNFSKFTVKNEIYAIGFILAYILNGNESLHSDNYSIFKIINKCTTTDNIDNRYSSVDEIIKDINLLRSM